MVKVILSGACGRMGQALAEVLATNDQITIVAALERAGHPLMGRTLPGTKVHVTSDFAALVSPGDVLVEFSDNAAVALEHVKTCAAAKAGAVVGTTGLSSEQTDELRSVGARIPVLVAPNLSLGVNLLYSLVDRAALILGADYDVGIIEAHHRMKKDAPSGTAKHLLEIIEARRGRDSEVVHGRNGLVGERKPAEIGVFSVRAGDIVGDHTIVFAGPGERLELTHRAHSRQAFAQGAVKAILFVSRAEPGYYGMSEVLENITHNV